MHAGLGLGCGHDGTGPAGGRPLGASPYGLLDMAGSGSWTITTAAINAKAPVENPVHDPSLIAGNGLRTLAWTDSRCGDSLRICPRPAASGKPLRETPCRQPQSRLVAQKGIHNLRGRCKSWHRRPSLWLGTLVIQSRLNEPLPLPQAKGENSGAAFRATSQVQQSLRFQAIGTTQELAATCPSHLDASRKICSVCFTVQLPFDKSVWRNRSVVGQPAGD